MLVSDAEKLFDAASEPFGTYLGLGFTMLFGFQAAVNMCMAMNLLPTKGLTLPLLSFGGSGIVANCIALAVLLRVDFENRQLLRGYVV